MWTDTRPYEYETTAAIVPCLDAEIVVDGRPAHGEVRPHADAFVSSAVLAFSETSARQSPWRWRFAGKAAGRGSRRDDELSDREAEVVRLIARGFSNKEIAARLDVSIKTVETYKARASEKLNLRTRVDIVRYGVAHGWLESV